MPLEVRPYLPADFNAWLDLTAISSIELNEEFLIWNDRPKLPPQSFSFLLTEKEQLLASADLVSLDQKNTLMVKHWATRKSGSKVEFANFIHEISQETNAAIRIWVNSPEMIQFFLTKPKVAIIENRVAFFVSGNFLPDLNQQIGFCDHIYGTSSIEMFEKLANSLPIVKNSFMMPKFQTCLEFSLP